MTTVNRLNSSPHITAFGGGTGLSTLLRGLKLYTDNITAVVTVADDGGSSGMLRNDYGILPPGDIRNCILALADVEPLMEQLLQYRFTDGNLKGQNLGNLLIAALTNLCCGFEKAIKEISNVLAVTGKVLPVSLDNLCLSAKLENGAIINGESKIPVIQMEQNSPIDEVFITPGNATALPEVIESIDRADAIVIGPGSLYTSIIPNLLVTDVREAIKRSTAKKIYVANIMTQRGETINFTLEDHIKAITKHCGANLIDKVIVNKQIPPENYLIKYKTEESKPIKFNEQDINNMGIEVIAGDLLEYSKGYLRHTPQKLAQLICDLL